ncbi:DUF262 domain-containing protein [Burkholderia glumae]|uniref:DUF262 domain-containing protein n=1 Tax=Burkholderia glumae TaxID=337 RepID=UPI0009B720E0|nr:DUF262 domain-containing protein [Burkholderia glumae]MCM2485797.1 DUF262 domain-containing protein [Burkholderia glumae]MCM2511639.1 DUF262 domain-containing protein [Burkholderia glumae]MCM2541846.1 DUF262 domain-containing protein [Burkholderia glumae]QKM57602.1 hypothetical protein CG017_05681 [Burkholderia glumae]
MTSSEEKSPDTATLFMRDGELEEEDVSGENLVVKPWDPKDIRITTKTFTIREIFIQIEDGDLDLAPDFQRSFVWKDRQQIRLVESIVLGIPLPAFYFNQDRTGAHQVIDGVQRLTTIKHFMSDELFLDAAHLEYLRVLEGMRYSTLDPATRRRFAGTQIVAHVIEPQTPDEVKYDIFNRVNTGGSPLTAQEIRHCMSKTRSRDFLRNLVETSNFDKATEMSFWSKDSTGKLTRDNHRMSDRELALRFCAFHTVSIDEYSKASSLDSFLLDFTRRIDEPNARAHTSVDLDTLAAAFSRAMGNAAAILGKAAFRRWLPEAQRRGPLNRAVFESQAIALSEYDLDELLPYKEEIREGFRNLFSDSEYDNAVRYGTGDYLKVATRLTKPRKMLREIVS